ncbi:unnamed protein product [Moneuplotes crassus]|uniref:Uncharacterized protein n=1 Tax=Euplotes crassus TaxID=5936 RepID=A0AAD2D7V4_EUPCR|nr:unnamed protein product [Moneuplotes crassus]
MNNICREYKFGSIPSAPELTSQLKKHARSLKLGRCIISPFTQIPKVKNKVLIFDKIDPKEESFKKAEQMFRNVLSNNQREDFERKLSDVLKTNKNRTRRARNSMSTTPFLPNEIIQKCQNYIKRSSRSSYRPKTSRHEASLDVPNNLDIKISRRTRLRLGEYHNFRVCKDDLLTHFKKSMKPLEQDNIPQISEEKGQEKQEWRAVTSINFITLEDFKRPVQTQRDKEYLDIIKSRKSRQKELTQAPEYSLNINTNCDSPQGFRNITLKKLFRNKDFKADKVRKKQRKRIQRTKKRVQAKLVPTTTGGFGIKASRDLIESMKVTIRNRSYRPKSRNKI